MSEKNTYATKSINPYQYWAKVIKVIDGDTIDCEVEIGFELTFKARIRLYGIAAPEIYGVKKNSLEYKNGVNSKKYLESLIPKNKWVEITVHQSAKREKYGRWLAVVYDGKVNINNEMVDKKHAEVYEK